MTVEHRFVVEKRNTGQKINDLIPQIIERLRVDDFLFVEDEQNGMVMTDDSRQAKREVYAGLVLAFSQFVSVCVEVPLLRSAFEHIVAVNSALLGVSQDRLSDDIVSIFKWTLELSRKLEAVDSADSSNPQ